MFSPDGLFPVVTLGNCADKDHGTSFVTTVFEYTLPVHHNC